MQRAGYPAVGMTRPPPPPVNPREAIVDKLNSALAVLRRDRDEEHRKKELAAERLRLLREEREAEEKKVGAMRSRLEEMERAAAGGKSAEENRKLQEEVERIGREAKFQHAELVAKKDKKATLEAKMEEDGKARGASLRLARDALRSRREKIALCSTSINSNRPTEGKEDTTAMLEKALSEADDDELLLGLPRLIEQKATEMTMEAGDAHREAEALRRRIGGYMRQFESGLTGVTGMEVSVMQQ